ncbi:MAG: SLC13 family permease [Pseudomonadota bacterium]
MMMHSPELGLHGIAVLILTIVALLMFRSERLPLESSCLIVLLLLAIGFHLFPYSNGKNSLQAQDFFHGFSHDALISVCSLMMAGQGLLRTGALEPIGRALSRLWRVNPSLSLLATLVSAGMLSAFMNNTPIVVLLMPILISVSLRTQSSSSAMLLPMGLATIVGGMSTTIGTSTNLLVVSVAEELGLEKIGMFDFYIPALMTGFFATLYLWLLAPKLIPLRDSGFSDTSPRIFTAQLSIKEESVADGMTLSDIIKKTDTKMKVTRIKRSQDTSLMPIPDTVIKAGDRLQVRDTPENLREFEQVLGAALYSGDNLVDESNPLSAENQQMAEVVVVRGSPLAGRTLKNVRFIDQYNLVTVALHRAGREVEVLRTGIGKVVLREGDVLLVQGSNQQIAKLKHQNELLVLDATEDLARNDKANIALIIMAAAIFASAVGIAPISISALTAVLIMIQAKCLTWREAGRSLSASVILIVVASLALGTALVKTGGVDFLAAWFVYFTQSLSPAYMLSALIFLLAILTNIVSNNAAAVIGTPIAVSVATQIGAPPEPFVIGVLFGANMSYATPMAYKTNLLVMNAGGYRFSDFLRVGIPLTLLTWLTSSIIIAFWYDI